MVLRVAVRPQRLAARAVERQRRGVHEHQRQVGEQVPPVLEQTLLHRILHAARRKRARRRRLQLLPEPGHRPIQLMKPQPLGPLDRVVGHPLLARPVRARHEQTVQNAHEHRPLDGEPEAPPVQKLLHDSAQAQPIPQPTEQQRTADPHAGQRARLHVLQHHGPFRMARQGRDQTVELPARLQYVLAAKRADRALAHPLALAHALDEIEIAVAPGGRFAHEHDRVVCLRYTPIKKTTPNQQKCFTTFFSTRANHHPTIQSFQQLGETGTRKNRHRLFKLGESLS